MTTRTQLFEHLMDEDFTPQDDGGAYEDWFDHKNVRVVITGMADEIDEVSVHVFTHDPARLLIWSATFTSSTPTAVIVATFKTAVELEAADLARARRFNR